MNRVDLLLEIGVDIETAVSIDQEVSRLPPRTQRVFYMRARGYNNREIGDFIGVTERVARYHVKKCKKFTTLCRFLQKSVHYSSRG